MKKLKSQIGFSMIEILVSILILSFGLLGLAALQAVGVKNSHSAYYRNQATIMAHEIIDRIRANPGVAYANVPSYQITLAAPAPGAPTVGVCPTGCANEDLSEWKNHIAATLPVGQGSVVAAGNKVTVVIQWDDSRGVGGTGTQQFSIETLI